jgi:hypothetical protein
MVGQRAGSYRPPSVLSCVRDLFGQRLIFPPDIAEQIQSCPVLSPL